jgi:hypothetical protein
MVFHACGVVEGEWVRGRAGIGIEAIRLSGSFALPAGGSKRAIRVLRPGCPRRVCAVGRPAHDWRLVEPRWGSDVF